MRRQGSEIFVEKGYTSARNKDVVAFYDKLKLESQRKEGYCVPVAFFIRESVVGDSLTCLVRQYAIRPLLFRLSLAF